MGENNNRRHCIPILYTKGTHYEVGYDVGRNFGSIIKSFLDNSYSLKEYESIYKTADGKRVYDETLKAVKDNFPQYIDEIQGTADGANVEFYKLFLMHMDDITPKCAKNDNIEKAPIGCSTVHVNQKNQQFLGHTEDTLGEVLNHFYFVSAHIINNDLKGKWKVKEEKFTSLCYAGHLPGYTMGYNKHGLMFTINTLAANRLNSGKIPRHLLCRALLSAKNFENAKEILLDKGCGAGDGCSINMTFLSQEQRTFYNIEMAPAKPNTDQSQLDIKEIPLGHNYVHCNNYLRMKIEEYPNCEMINSSLARLEALNKYSELNKEALINMLGDQTNSDYPVFQNCKTKREDVRTIAVGIFDCIEKTWSIYADNPKFCEPLVVLQLKID